MNYWIIATIVICLFIWYIVKCWSKSFEIVNEGALAQEREAILEIIEQERPLEYAHISNIDYRQKKKHIYHFIKRLTDIAGSLVGIILLSPIFLLLSFLVKREDGGNIFYGHIRVGYHGKKIKVYKFRSMKMNVKNLEKLLTPEQAKELEKKKTETEVKAQEEPEAEEVEETTENNEPEVQVSMEGIQEKISKGIRDVFGGKTQEEKEEFPEESMDMVNEAGITREDEIPEEIIKSDASQKEPENVPELEAEPEKPGAEPMAAIKMPELNIPESMKNMELSKPPKVEEVAETKLNMDSFDLEGKELNLEDTILAAASAQGIEIPKEEESKTEEVQEESSETDVDDKEIKAHDISEELEEPDFLSGDIKDIKVADPKPDEEPKKEIPVQPEIEEAEEEDEVTEEDLRRAEEEFLHGPIGNTDLNPEDDTEGTEEAQPLTEEEELERFIESIQPENGADPRDIVPRRKRTYR